MNEQFSKEDIVGVECRHVFYVPPPKNSPRADDYHLAKEIIHLKDGRKIPHVRLWKNFKRRYWLVRPAFRKYTQKKEWEDVRKLQEFKARQCDLKDAVAASLGMRGFQGSMRKLQNNPHIYGTDILSTSVVKREIYRDRFPGLNTPSDLAVCDTETDMIHGHERVIMTTITYKDKAFTTITKDFLKKHPNALERLHELSTKYLGDIMAARKIKWEIQIVNNDIDSMYHCIQKAHEWRPDFLVFWNMDFDISKMIEAFERERIDPADVFCDPSIPRSHRYFNYIRGAAQKVTASGKVTPVKPAARWHTVECPASFYVIDAMCVYKQIRTGQAEKPSYALDAILKSELKGVQKLKFEEANHLQAAEWHIFMQRFFELEYVVYNLFDCVCVEMLDEKTRDLSTAFPSGAGDTDYKRFNSQPRKLCDKLHYFAMQRGLIMACTGDEMKHELDQHVIGINDWIVMLPAHLVADTGLRIIEGAPELPTKIYLHVGDLDVSASYPWGEACLNISKKTTRCELIDIEGVTEHMRRMQGINLSAGATNAVEFCTSLFGLPTPIEWEEAFLADRAAEQLAIGVSNPELIVPTVPFAFQAATREFTCLDDSMESEEMIGEMEEEEEQF